MQNYRLATNREITYLNNAKTLQLRGATCMNRRNLYSRAIIMIILRKMY